MTIYPRLGAITRTGDEALRSVLVVGATAVFQQVRRGKGHPLPWLVELLKRSRPSLPPWRWPTKHSPAHPGDGPHRLEADGSEALADILLPQRCAPP